MWRFDVIIGLVLRTYALLGKDSGKGNSIAFLVRLDVGHCILSLYHNYGVIGYLHLQTSSCLWEEMNNCVCLLSPVRD